MNTLQSLWRIKPLRLQLGFMVLMLVLFRVLAHIPVPGLDASVLRGVLANNAFLGLLNIFSGGTLENFSVVALGVAPFITSSIIFQLLGMVIPSLHRLQKEEGEAGRARINRWTRIATVPFALIQAYGVIATVAHLSGTGGMAISGAPLLLAMFMMTVGTIFLMWIGEVLSQKGIGNGMSLIIFAGIISGLPSALQQLFGGFSSDQTISMLAFGLIALLTVVAVVVISEATRNIPLQYARHHAGNRLTSGVQTKLPLKLLMVGVMPIIFAVAFLVFPTTLAQFFLRAKTLWITKVAEWIIVTFQNPWFYGILFFLLVFGFTFFYASVVFRPDEMAENLQKQGAFVPGVRPGLPTQEYLSSVVKRLLFTGGAFLGIIAILPSVIQPLTGSQNVVIGGTSVLIVVSVVVEIVKQVEAQIASYRYDNM